ncbi:MAG: helix-turn-helix transcriptional regulator [Lachnospiraceae bacterium]|nr:helix-turn-helix transcriptional regulator [Lachnospiraceae bacterium]
MTEERDHLMRERIDLPMTELEQALKICLQARPDIRTHILTAQELADYTAWMAREYGPKLSREKREAMFQDIHAESRSQHMATGRKLLSNPTDTSALKQVSSHWGDQEEGSYIHPDQDISVWQMIRYMPAHWHRNQYFEIYYALSGECPVHFSNEVVTVKPGTVLIVAPSVLHASPCYADDQVLLYYNIRSSTFDQVFWNQLPSGNLMSGFFRQALSGQQPNSYIQFETNGDPEIQDLMEGIFLEYQLDLDFSGKLMNAYMSACLILLLRRYEGSVRLPRSESFFWKHEYSAVLSYIQNHYADVRLEDLAAHFHYSEKQIRRIVHSCTGICYSDLIARLRMEKAALLLRRGTASIEQIAQVTGYTTVSSFYRGFTRYYHCTPLEYQKNIASDPATA